MRTSFPLTGACRAHQGGGESDARSFARTCVAAARLRSHHRRGRRIHDDEAGVARRRAHAARRDPRSADVLHAGLGAARASLKHLADYAPNAAITGHGPPLRGDRLQMACATSPSTSTRGPVRHTDAIAIVRRSPTPPAWSTAAAADQREHRRARRASRSAPRSRSPVCAGATEERSGAPGARSTRAATNGDVATERTRRRRRRSRATETSPARSSPRRGRRSTPADGSWFTDIDASGTTAMVLATTGPRRSAR